MLIATSVVDQGQLSALGAGLPKFYKMGYAKALAMRVVKLAQTIRIRVISARRALY